MTLKRTARRGLSPNPTLVGLAAVGFLSISFQIMLPVVPILLERTAPHGGAGAATAALFLGLVGGEFLTPSLITRLSSKYLLLGSELLVAIPSLVFVFPNSTVWQMLIATTVRGAGTGIGIVVVLALVSEFGPPDRRGRTMGSFSLAVGTPAIIFPSIGVIVLATAGAPFVAVMALVSGFAGAVSALKLKSSAGTKSRLATNLVMALREPGFPIMFVGFSLANCTFGGVVTYVPIALPPQGLGSAATFLLVSGVSRAASRWVSGILGDYWPIRLINGAAIGLLAIGLVPLAVHAGPEVLVIGAIAYGAGHGSLLTGVYIAMIRVSRGPNWTLISTLWNGAIDLGSSAGGILVGVLAALYGYAAAIWLLPAVGLATLPLLAMRSQADSRTPRASA